MGRLVREFFATAKMKTMSADAIKHATKRVFKLIFCQSLLIKIKQIVLNEIMRFLR